MPRVNIKREVTIREAVIEATQDELLTSDEIYEKIRVKYGNLRKKSVKQIISVLRADGTIKAKWQIPPNNIQESILKLLKSQPNKRFTVTQVYNLVIDKDKPQVTRQTIYSHMENMIRFSKDLEKIYTKGLGYYKIKTI